MRAMWPKILEHCSVTIFHWMRVLMALHCRMSLYVLLYVVHVLRKEDGDWVKKCMECEIEGSRPKRT